MAKRKLRQMLKAWRKEHNLTQAEAAKALGISRASVEAYEQDLREPRGLASAVILERLSKPPERT